MSFWKREKGTKVAFKKTWDYWKQAEQKQLRLVNKEQIKNLQEQKNIGEKFENRRLGKKGTWQNVIVRKNYRFKKIKRYSKII